MLECNKRTKQVVCSNAKTSTADVIHFSPIYKDSSKRLNLMKQRHLDKKEKWDEEDINCKLKKIGLSYTRNKPDSKLK